MSTKLKNAAHEFRSIVDDARTSGDGTFMRTVKYTAGGLGLATYSAISEARRRRETEPQGNLTAPSQSHEMHAPPAPGEHTPPPPPAPER